MIVLDASVLIAHLDAGDAHHQRAEALLLATADEAWGASPLSIAEVLVGPARAGQLDLANAALHQLEALGDFGDGDLAVAQRGDRPSRVRGA